MPNLIAFLLLTLNSSVCRRGPCGCFGSRSAVWGHQGVDAGLLCWPVHGGTNYPNTHSSFLFILHNWLQSLIFWCFIIYSLTRRQSPLQTSAVSPPRLLTQRGTWGFCWVSMPPTWPRAPPCPPWRSNVPVSSVISKQLGLKIKTCPPWTHLNWLHFYLSFHRMAPVLHILWGPADQSDPL